MLSRVLTPMALGLALALSSADAFTVTFKNGCGSSMVLFDASTSETIATAGSTSRTITAGSGAYSYRYGTGAQATLAEFSGDSGKAWYDISIIPTGSVGPGTCSSLADCKSVTGGVGFNVAMSIAPSTTDSDRCTTLTCLEDGCDDAYQYPSDDTKTHSCSISTDFTVTFCPNGSTGSSSSTPTPTTATPTPTTATPTPTTATPTPTTATPTPTTATPTSTPSASSDSSSAGSATSSAGSASATGTDSTAGSSSAPSGIGFLRAGGSASDSASAATGSGESTATALSVSKTSSTTTTSTTATAATTTDAATGTTSATTTGSSTDVAQTANTQSSSESTTGAGVYILSVLGAAGMVAGVAIFAVRRKKMQLDAFENKTPIDNERVMWMTTPQGSTVL